MRSFVGLPCTQLSQVLHVQQSHRTSEGATVRFAGVNDTVRFRRVKSCPLLDAVCRSLLGATETKHGVLYAFLNGFP